jgi:hypothetical protein
MAQRNHRHEAFANVPLMQHLQGGLIDTQGISDLVEVIF